MRPCLRGIAVKAAAQGSPLRFPDTMSARYHMNDVSSLLRGKKVAIIGLGGTGSYILDFVARTHLEQIALFDDDKVHVHTIFRIPGFHSARNREAQGRRARAAIWAMARGAGAGCRTHHPGEYRASEAILISSSFPSMTARRVVDRRLAERQGHSLRRLRNGS